MEKVRHKCGFPNGIDVDSDGRSGSLSLGWNSDSKITLRSFSRRHTDVIIDEDLEGKTWRCTMFYEAPEETMHEASWNLLRTLNDSLYISWIVIGDFNEIAFSTEKKDGLLRRERQMCRFQDVMEDCSLTNLGYSWQWFTWEKDRIRNKNIQERLDRDHCPLLLNSIFGNQHPKQGYFRFETTWLLEETYEMELLKLNEAIPTDEILGEIVEMKLALNIEADRDELYWEQRARANWLKNGDRNTNFSIDQQRIVDGEIG
ncbi:uncharacterized protein LOC105795620 [Gossypium raimondii]|uniref:uncharacterized protein LOC105795620 n=1 Tax=Gossypium raimondii TaxID=29730 RepID=UPI00227D17F1|nr:uncharacterized protein LOC105795620 [Gossypium raimondii]